MPVPPPIAVDLVPLSDYGIRIVATCAILTSMALYGFLAWMAEVLDRGCPSCAHCQDKRKRRQDTEAKAAQATRERLFGVQIVDGEQDEEAARSAESQDRPEHDEGREEPGSG